MVDNATRNTPQCHKQTILLDRSICLSFSDSTRACVRRPSVFYSQRIVIIYRFGCVPLNIWKIVPPWRSVQTAGVQSTQLKRCTAIEYGIPERQVVYAYFPFICLISCALLRFDFFRPSSTLSSFVVGNRSHLSCAFAVLQYNIL